MIKIFYENLNDLSLLQNLIKTMNVSKLKSLNSKFIYASERKRRAALLSFISKKLVQKSIIRIL